MGQCTGWGSVCLGEGGLSWSRGGAGGPEAGSWRRLGVLDATEKETPPVQSKTQAADISSEWGMP